MFHRQERIFSAMSKRDNGMDIGLSAEDDGADDQHLAQVGLLNTFCDLFTGDGYHQTENFDDIWRGFQTAMASGTRTYGIIKGDHLVGKTNLIRGFAGKVARNECIPLLRGRTMLKIRDNAVSAVETPEAEAMQAYLRAFKGADCGGFMLYTDDDNAAKAFLSLPELEIPFIYEDRSGYGMGGINIPEDDEGSERVKSMVVSLDRSVPEIVKLISGIINDNAEHYRSRYGLVPSDDAINVITRMMVARSVSEKQEISPWGICLVIENFLSEYSSDHDSDDMPSVDDAYAYASKDFDMSRKEIDSLPDAIPENYMGDILEDESVDTATGNPAGKTAAGSRKDETDENGFVFSDKKDLLQRLQSKVVGQDDALNEIVKPIVRRKAGLGDPEKPIASLLFAGPSGVGKTETAKALAEAVFGDENAFKRIDCGEMVSEMGVSRLLGSAPGYVAFESGGELSNFIAGHPHSVILFDEIEKAGDRFYDSVFLQLMSAGRITGSVRTETKGPEGKPMVQSQVKTVDARGCIIIMTSNIGSQDVGDKGMDMTGFGLASDGDADRLDKDIRDAVTKHFRIEFINRLDGIIVFHALDRASLAKVFTMKWLPNEKRIKERGISVSMDDSVPDWFADISRKDKMGARNLIRIMDDNLINPMADIILDEHKGKGSTLKVSVTKGRNGKGKELRIS